MDLSIIPECFADTSLIETLVPPTKIANKLGYNHQKGCNKVASVMQINFSNKFAVGIIDKDKRQISYIKEFKTIVDGGAIILHKHQSKSHYLIQINPAIESFIIENAKKAGINLMEFDLSSDIDKFKKITKSSTSKVDTKLIKLFKALKDKPTQDILKLSSWIEYLKDKKYGANIEEIKQL